VRVKPGERARTTVDLAREELLLVEGSGSTVLKYMVPCEGHPWGSWYIESDCPLEVTKLINGRRKLLRFVER
jgi:hypothetical protein